MNAIMKKRTNSDLVQSDKNKKVKVGIICAILAIITLICIAVAVLLNQSGTYNNKNENASGQETTIIEELTVDFNQKIPTEDGEDAKTSYELGDKNNFSIRFPDLKCNEQCSNVKNLKLNGRALEAKKDYEVKPGSVIIVIFSEYMETLEVGQFELTFEITSDEKGSIIGLDITITDDVPTCTDSQILEGNKCTEKKIEQPIATNTQKPASTTPSNSNNTAWNEASLVDYSTGVAAYNIPEPNFHAKLSRAEYNANRGWESKVFETYASHLRQIKQYGENYTDFRNYSQSSLCFGRFDVDVDNMTISNPQWDTQPTSTCDRVRNEFPPVPSEQYLTDFFRKVAASDCYLTNTNGMYCRNPQW